MTRSRIRVSLAAKADLLAIARHTQSQWGPEQRDTYLARFERAFDALSENTQIGTACDEIRLGYRKLVVGRHRIFYRFGADSAVEVVRILHQSMDVDLKF